MEERETISYGNHELKLTDRTKIVISGIKKIINLHKIPCISLKNSV